MHRRRPALIACLAALAWQSLPVSAAPRQPPAAAPEADPLKPTFDALTEPERRGLQNALVWTDGFNGVVSGTYGPRTRDALLAHAASVGVPPAAALDPPVRVRLLAEAEAARRAVGFTMVRDPRAGLAIGLPLTMLPVRSTLPTGTRYASKDGATVIETAGRSSGPDGLADVFARLTRDAPGRRVTYKLAKPDFIVVSGEAANGKFYSRSALGLAPGGGGVIRSMTLTYPKDAPDVDRIALAVAASFDPFPASEPASAPPRPAPASLPAVPTTVLSGDAVLVGPGLALTWADASHCAEAEVGGAAARWMRQDPASGLALLALPGHADAAPVAVATAPLAPDAPLLALFLVPGGPAPVLSAAGVTWREAGIVRAPLQGTSAGAVLVDGTGTLAGLVATRTDGGATIGDVVAESSYRVVDSGTITTFLRDAAVPFRPAGTSIMAPGEAATRWRPAILPLRCRATPSASAAP